MLCVSPSIRQHTSAYVLCVSPSIRQHIGLLTPLDVMCVLTLLDVFLYVVLYVCPNAAVYVCLGIRADAS
jgi:hypothetical protein